MGCIYAVENKLMRESKLSFAAKNMNFGGTRANHKLAKGCP